MYRRRRPAYRRACACPPAASDRLEARLCSLELHHTARRPLRLPAAQLELRPLSRGPRSSLDDSSSIATSSRDLQQQQRALALAGRRQRGACSGGRGEELGLGRQALSNLLLHSKARSIPANSLAVAAAATVIFHFSRSALLPSRVRFSPGTAGAGSAGERALPLAGPADAIKSAERCWGCRLQPPLSAAGADVPARWLCMGAGGSAAPPVPPPAPGSACFCGVAHPLPGCRPC